MSKSIPELAADTRMLIEHLETAFKTNDMVTYKDLSDLVGRDIQGSARTNLNTARRVLLRDLRINTAVVREVGIKRLTDVQTVDGFFDHGVPKFRRALKREAKKLTTVDYASLDRATQVKQNTGLAYAGALLHASTNSSVKKLEKSVGAAGGTLPVAKTLEIFAK